MGCGGVQRCEASGQVHRGASGIVVAGAQQRRFRMLMFKRSQLYLGLALAGLAEIIIRAVTN